LLAAELAWWSIECGGAVVQPAGLDRLRLATIVGIALGGAAFGGLAVGLVYAHAASGSLAVVIAGALAACLVVGLATLLGPDRRPR